MLEIRQESVAIVACHATSGALRELEKRLGKGEYSASNGFWIAPDELWRVEVVQQESALVRRCEEVLATIEPATLVVDASDGWALFRFRDEEKAERVGSRRLLALVSQLMEIALPETRPFFLQCAFADVPGKLLSTDAGLDLFVPSPFADFVARRIRDVADPVTTRLVLRKPPSGESAS
ncbi:MAG: hypothetical protein ABI639_11060 [Thermoanaerobaculia bacterium]